MILSMSKYMACSLYTELYLRGRGMHNFLGVPSTVKFHVIVTQNSCGTILLSESNMGKPLMIFFLVTSH